MVEKLYVILYTLVVYGVQSHPVFAPKAATSNCGSICNFRYKFLSQRVEYLENKLLQQQSNIERLINLVIKVDDKLIKEGQTFTSRLNLIPDKILRLESETQNHLESVEKQTSARYEEILSKATSMHETCGQSATLAGNHSSAPESEATHPVYRSCSEEPTKMSGVYWLKPVFGEKPFQGYCEQQKFGGGWLVMQHRFNGSVDFYREWTDYRDGFGQPEGEHWLGLEKLHRLTSAERYTLVVELESVNGSYGYAKYESFQIGSEADNYKLTIGTHSGTLGNAMIVNNEKPFTTKDKDNEPSDSNCASWHFGAWWYGECTDTNLNGLYYTSIYWTDFTQQHDFTRVTRMMIKAEY